jgi:PKHD-type hydroxylase
MRYGNLYQTANVSEKLINETLSHVNLETLVKAHVSNIKSDNPNDPSNSYQGKGGRTNRVSFIHDKQIQEKWLSVARTVNKDLGWDFNLTAIEPIQYGEYAKSEEYSWHVDQHRTPYKDNMIRKISFSVFLNNDYTGGEFDLEIYPPNRPKRFKTFNELPTNTILFFQSEYWHRVRPVHDGVRKSLVGWVLGPKFR